MAPGNSLGLSHGHLVFVPGEDYGKSLLRAMDEFIGDDQSGCFVILESNRDFHWLPSRASDHDERNEKKKPTTH